MDESERLIALAAMAGPERSLAAWQQWRAANDVAQASALLGWAAGYIHRNLDAAGVQDRYLGGIARHNWISNNRRVVAALPTIHALAALGQLTPLKSFGMSQSHFSRGLRPIADFDFFLPQRSIGAARDLLAARGFHPQLALTVAEFDDRVLPQRGSWNFLGSDGVADLDLHWRLLEHLPTSLSEQLVAANSTSLDTEFGRVRHLDPELMMVCLAVHHLVQGEGTWNGMFDVHHLIADADPARVVALTYQVGVPDELFGVIREIRELLADDASSAVRELDDRLAAATRPGSSAGLARIPRVLGRAALRDPRRDREPTMLTRRARAWILLGRPRRLERILRRFGPLMRDHRSAEAGAYPRGGGRLGPGWNHPYPADPHRWAIRPDARLTFENVPPSATTLILGFTADVWDRAPSHRVLVVVDGIPVGTCQHGVSDYRFALPPHGATVEVSLRVPRGAQRTRHRPMQRHWYRMLAPVREARLD